MTASPASNNDRLLSGWEHLNVFTAFKWMEMTCLHIVWQVAACQDLEGLVYCHDRHQTVLFLFLWQRGREICAYDRGWLDIHVALIILPLLLGSHSGVGQALMWVWSHVTLGCWAEVAYWCRHHIVTHISYHGRLFELKASLCVCLSCSVAVWMGTESRLCERCCLGSSWSPGNLEEMSTASQNANTYANISCMHEK